MLYFSVAHEPHNDLAVRLGCEIDERGLVVVDFEGMTTVPHIYAAGDLVPGLQLTQVAAARGAVAGVSGAPSSPPPAPDAVAEREGRPEG